MGHPTFDDARELAAWRPPHGVITVYMRLDPADRAGAWRTELRNSLSDVLEARTEVDHETRKALTGTAERVAARFANHERDLPRGETGFIEVASGDGEQRWWSTHLAPEAEVSACFAERPVVSPFLFLAEHGCPRGVALVSSERVRLLEWAPGFLVELDSRELGLYSGDWRERKAPRVPDPARGQGVSAAGRDQFGERLAGNRDRFLEDCGRAAAGLAAERRWPELVVFGAAEPVRSFRQGADPSFGTPLEVGGEADLISAPDGELLERIEQTVRRLSLERDRSLVEHALEEARGGAHGTAGPQETLAALEEGRVAHLVVDASQAAAACSGPVVEADQSPENGEVALEPLIGRALASGAKINTVLGEAAEMLEPADGVAALLRY